MSLLGRRAFFAADVPFLVGRYPDRPAPTHVLNAVLSGAFGPGDNADTLRLMLRGEGLPHDAESWLPDVRHDRQRVDQFRRAMRVVFDADGKVFPSVGSPFPLHPGIVSKDPSDDGLGQAAWRLIATHVQDAQSVLASLWSGETFRDGLAELAEVVGGSWRLEETPRPQHSTGEQLFKGPVGSAYERALAELAVRPLRKPQHVTRSFRIAATLRGMFAAVFLATLRAPEFRRRAIGNWADLAPMFVFGGVPPGYSKSPEVRVAARSFEGVTRSHRENLRAILRARIARRRIAVPRSQYARVLLASSFQLDDRTRREAEALLGQSTNPDNIAARIVDAVYPAGHLERGFRSMGSKVGLAGPDRGGGNPRFVLETPILAALVDVSLGDDRALAFEDWLDRLYDLFGFVVGRGRTTDFEQVLSSLDSSGLIARALDSNHEAFRRRMIRAGLAVEYSDAETEVRRANS